MRLMPTFGKNLDGSTDFKATVQYHSLTSSYASMCVVFLWVSCAIRHDVIGCCRFHGGMISQLDRHDDSSVQWRCPTASVGRLMTHKNTSLSHIYMQQDRRTAWHSHTVPRNTLIESGLLFEYYFASHINNNMDISLGLLIVQPRDGTHVTPMPR